MILPTQTSPTDYTKWPVEEFERRFYRQIDVGGYAYLVPNTVLGMAISTKADNARIDVARNAITALAPTTKEGAQPTPTSEEISSYIQLHYNDEPILKAWLGAIYIPLPGSPSVDKIYRYIPYKIIAETQDFFVQSLPEYSLKSKETTTDSTT